VPLTRAQVREAFKRARAHYKGKIPKGTKLSSFLPGSRHSTSGNSRHDSSTGGRVATPSKARRAGGKVKKFAGRHPKLTTRGANALGLLISFNQEINSAVANFQGGVWTTKPAQAAGDLLYNATGFNPNTGQFNQGQLLVSAGSKVGGYVFSRVVKKLLKTMPVM
jgi:hypothetical protein